jgi:cyclophilin family peptidyl-prolyl cis-trans isomerase
MAVLAAILMTSPAFAVEQVVIETNYGKITVELDDEKAPLSVANFLSYVDSGHYKDTIFHRVIKDFMIQGGNFTTEMVPKKTTTPIKNEAGNGLRNLRGTIAMARTGVIDSATSQFFINLKDNDFLDHKDNSIRGYGYAVFGKVTGGMDVVDKIGTSPTHTFRQFSDVPVEPVVILNITHLAKP